MLGIQSLVWNALTLTVQLAIFNTIINSCTALVTLPFLNQFAGIVEAISPKKSEGQNLHIQRVGGWLHEAIPGVQLRTLRLDTKIVIKEMINYMLYLFEMKISVAEKKKEKQLSSWSMRSFFKEFFSSENIEATDAKEKIISVSYDQETHKTMYETTKEHIDLIMKTLLPIKTEELNQIEQYEQDQLEWTIEDIVDVMKLTKNIREDILVLKPGDTKEENTPYHILQKVVRTLWNTTLSILSSTDYEYKVELLSNTASNAKYDLENLNEDIIETIRHESSTKLSISTLLNIINHLQQLILFWQDAMSHLIHAQHKFKAMAT